MAIFKFTVYGQGSTVLELPVEVTPETVYLDGLETEEVAVTIRNTLNRSVTFTQVTITISGNAASKVSATLRFDNFTIPAGGIYNNVLDVQSNEILQEGDSFAILVESTENQT
jgi:uncharacterized protein YlaN (UPF0358 family)